MMSILQLSVFLENQPGTLAKAVALLADNMINIRAISLAETESFGILRIIVSEPEKAKKILDNNNFPTSLHPVVAAEVPDTPGGLAFVVNLLDKAHVNIEYMYGFIEKKPDHALMVFRIENLEEAETLLTENKIRLIQPDDIQSL